MESSAPLLIGDHVICRRALYTHHGLYLGDGNVIEYLKNDGVTIVSLEEFASGSDVFIREHKMAKYSRTEAMNRAMMRLGEKKYNLFTNNCEHFVNWCIEGVSYSRQVDNVLITCLPFAKLFTSVAAHHDKHKSDSGEYLSVIFSDSHSVVEAFERLRHNTQTAKDADERARQMTDDMFGSTNDILIMITSMICKLSQNSHSYQSYFEGKEESTADKILRRLKELKDYVKQKFGFEDVTKTQGAPQNGDDFMGAKAKSNTYEVTTPEHAHYLRQLRDDLSEIKHNITLMYTTHPHQDTEGDKQSADGLLERVETKLRRFLSRQNKS